MKKFDINKIYIAILLVLCLVFLFLIGIFLLESRINKAKHIPISEGFTYNTQILYSITI